VVTPRQDTDILKTHKVVERVPMFAERDSYEIRLRGHLDERWVSWFEGFTIAHDFQNGVPVTKLSGSMADQAALHGVLIKLRDIGIPILSINLVEPENGEDK